jgi:ComF family protein
MVHGLKYGNLRVLSPLMASLMVESLEGAPFDVIVPVPLHPRRERNRGYNQAELLARGIAAEVGVYCESNCLARMRNTPAQVGLEGMEARRSNVANAFQARRRFDGQSVLVVDDVCTTGATLEACGLALKAAGAIAVRGIVFAR